MGEEDCLGFNSTFCPSFFLMFDGSFPWYEISVVYMIVHTMLEQDGNWLGGLWGLCYEKASAPPCDEEAPISRRILDLRRNPTHTGRPLGNDWSRPYHRSCQCRYSVSQRYIFLFHACIFYFYPDIISLGWDFKLVWNKITTCIFDQVKLCKNISYIILILIVSIYIFTNQEHWDKCTDWFWNNWFWT